MKIKMRWKHDIQTGATIQEFARMEMHPTTPIGGRVFIDHVSIPVCNVSGYMLIIHIALGKDGYHTSTEYETNTGGGGSLPSLKSKPHKTKKGAFEAGIKDLMEREYLKQFNEHLRRALLTFHSTSYVQLTLF